MYNLRTSSKVSDVLSIGYHRNNQTDAQQLINSEKTKVNEYVRTFLKMFLALLSIKKNANSDLGEELTLLRNSKKNCFTPSGFKWS